MSTVTPPDDFQQLSLSIATRGVRRAGAVSRGSWLLLELTYGPGALLALGLAARRTKAAIRPRKRMTRSFWVPA